MKNLTLKATAIGSLPHKDSKDAISLIFDTFKDIPFWPQLSNINKHEEMTIQYLQGIPGLKFDEEHGKLFYDALSDEFFIELEEFFMDYEAIVNEKNFSSLDKYAITPPYSSAISLYFEKLKNKNYEYAKGQIIGPFTWGTSICDKDNVCAFYDETYREVLIKGLTLKAVWQIEQIKKHSPETTPIIFMDEPVMSQYGTSAFITVKREDIVNALSDITKVIKDFGGLSAVHCCGKSDWSVLIDSGIDMINFDAFAYTKSLGAYAKDMDRFLKKDGYIAWGLVPTLDRDALEKVTLEDLIKKFENGVSDLEKKSNGKISKDMILKHSLFTPSCGAGGLNKELAQKAMKLVEELSVYFSKKYFNNYEV